jgi:hypothetical protein
MYSDNFYSKKNIRKIRSEIRKADNKEQFADKYVIIEGIPYRIVGKYNQSDDNIVVTDMSGKSRSVEVDSISKIGKIQRLFYGENTYFKIDSK